MTDVWEGDLEYEPAGAKATATGQPLLLPRRSHESGWRLHHLMLLVLGCAVVFWLVVILFFAIGPAAVALLVLLAMMGFVAGFVIVVRGFRTQRDALLWALAIAGERGMPLGPALDAVGDQCGFFFRGRVHALADSLNYGEALPDALDRVRGVLPRDAEVILPVGWQTGALPAALREAAALRSERRPAWVGLTSRLAYLMAVLMVMQTIVGFILYFIVPKFEAIFKDFGIELPPMTIVAIQVSHMGVKYGFGIALLLALQLGIIIALVLSFVGWLSFPIPGLDRLFVRRHSGLILRSLAVAVEAEKPLPVALDLLAERYPARWVRDRLIGALSDVRRGVDWSRALHENRLLRRADVAVLDAARRSGNLVWALRETAETGERRLAYRMQVLLQLLFPLMVLALGMLVLMMAVAFFAPLVSLIQRLSG